MRLLGEMYNFRLVDSRYVFVAELTQCKALLLCLPQNLKSLRDFFGGNQCRLNAGTAHTQQQHC